MIKVFKIIKNYFFCLRYPFYKVRNMFDGRFLGYEFTWYDDIPIGWRKAFGKQFSKELKKQLKKDNQLKEFRFSDIKEKWGSLRIYTQGCSEECWKLFDRYEELSSHYCIECGKRGKIHPKYYSAPLCDKHFKENYNNDFHI